MASGFTTTEGERGMGSSTAARNRGSYTHNFFPYPAKFPPEPAVDFLLAYSQPGQVVLDPFCGSGTVLVEALRNGRRGLGIELNPVAAIVARAKARAYSSADLDSIRSLSAEVASAESRVLSWTEEALQSVRPPNYKNISHWFKQEMIEELAAIRAAFIHGPKVSDRVRELATMAFLKVIVPVSNQDGETRYAAVEKPNVVRGTALRKFRETLDAYVEALENDVVKPQKGHEAKVIEGDSKKELARLPAGSVHLAITSPPYLNTFDYYLYHKHRIFWMNRNPVDIRRQEVGCHHRVDTMSYDDSVEEYTSYLEGVLQQVHRLLVSRGHFAMLIGDGIVKDRVLDARALVEALAARTSYEVVEAESRDLRDVSRRFIKGESLDRKRHHAIVLRKVDHAKAE